ncbi:MAG: hypothetical protein OXE77_11795 [Flavobacteriaceae bacterium]|nr:hypothetical protein [Flavobacteriaceae bacterium]MCY4268538.1 hypothetical protein [Flavobacteriaceae bacterium]
MLRFRRIAHTRFIFVTHNATIPLFGDAEQVSFVTIQIKKYLLTVGVLIATILRKVL